MVLRRAILKAILIRRIQRRLNKKLRSMYIRPIFNHRNVYGETNLVNELRDDPLYHFKYFRMDKMNFDEILNKIRPQISHASTHARPISALQRLAVTLRYLASGNSQVSLAMNYRISPASLCVILRETMTAICEEFEGKYLPPPTTDIWKANEIDFKLFWNFINACGALDGKHIRIRAPNGSGSTFYNYKSYFSLVLLAICNAKYMFTAVNIGSFGSESDGGILMRSNIGKRLATGTFNLPDPKPINASGCGPELPYVILGDSGFPLKPYLMCPYKGDFISQEKKTFNYRLSRARMVVENSFGILAARWRIFHTCIQAEVELVKLITRTCVILHNFLVNKRDFNGITVDRHDGEAFVPGNWRETTSGDTGMIPLSTQGSSNYSNSASDIRNEFTNFFTQSGRVSWEGNIG